MLAPRARGPRTRRPGARLWGGGGRARAPPRLVPPRRRRRSCRSPSGSRERHKLPREPAAPEAGPRPGLEGAPPGRRKFLGALPSPAPRPAPPRLQPLSARRPPRRAARQPAPMSAWATCDPRAPGGPLPPAGLARRRGPPPPLPPPAQRKAATPETSPGRAGRGSRPGPRASPLPCSREATIRAGRAGRVVRERARVGRWILILLRSLPQTQRTL
ncbi:uncharacterized protein LOC144613133 [Panthera onca]